jgi:hypothetical protein
MMLQFQPVPVLQQEWSLELVPVLQDIWYQKCVNGLKNRPVPEVRHFVQCGGTGCVMNVD